MPVRLPKSSSKHPSVFGALAGLAWFLLFTTALYFTREPAHRVIASLSRVLRRGLRPSWCLHTSVQAPKPLLAHSVQASNLKHTRLLAEASLGDLSRIGAAITRSSGEQSVLRTSRH